MKYKRLIKPYTQPGAIKRLFAYLKKASEVHSPEREFSVSIPYELIFPHWGNTVLDP